MRSPARSALPVTALAIAFIAVPVQAQIFQPGTQPMGEEGGIEMPLQSNGSCARCHGSYAPDDDYEPWDSWRGAMMSHAGRDPIFLAALAIAEADHPDARDFCVRCHSMPSWLREGENRHELGFEEDGFYTSANDGVACMVCHRSVRPEDPSQIGNARLVFLDGEDSEVRLGPYEPEGDTTAYHPMRKTDWLADSALCGQCHDISNPILEGRTADGEPTGRPFAVERTYSEWANSAFAERGETCQDCHMPEVEGPVRAAADGPERDYFRRHDLAGGSVWQPLALAAFVPGADEALRPYLEASSARARSMLESAAQLEVTEHEYEGGRATATVRVTNLSGHKLPTGYPEGRRMWLEVALVDEEGEVRAGSGVYDPDGDELPTDAQLRTYEVKLGQGDEPSFHFILNDTILLDTRIPPEGFAPPGDRDMSPVGRDYGDGEGGFRHWDETSYDLEAACGTGDLRLRVRLRYQSTTPEYIRFLRDTAPDSTDPNIGNWGEIAYDLWQTHGGDEPVDMATVEMPLGPAPEACPEPEPDAGMPEPEDAGTPDVEDAGADPIAAEEDDGGCGCSAPGAPASEAGWAWLFLLGGLALLRWRR